MGFFDSISGVANYLVNPKQSTEDLVVKPYQNAKNELARHIINTQGKDAQKMYGMGSFWQRAGEAFVPQIIEDLGFDTEDKDRFNEILEDSAYGPLPTFNESYTPTALPDPLQIERSARRMRTLLGAKKGFKSTNITGGLYSRTQGTKPTLFTL